MRRFVAYLILCVSMLLGIGFHMGQLTATVNPGVDYSGGKEFVYRVQDKTDEESPLQDDDLNRLANQLSDRLNRAGVSRYQIEIEGNDQIRVAVSSKSSSQYEHIQKLMAFDGSNYTLATTNEVEVYSSADNYNLFSGDARIDYKGAYPFFCIPLTKEGKEKVEALRTEATKLKNENATTDEEGNVSETTPKEAYIQLWTNFEDGDSWSFATESHASAEDQVKAEAMKEKILCAFDYQSMYWDDNQDVIALSMMSLVDTDNTPTVAEVRQAVELGQQYVNLFNSRELAYKVTFLYSDFTEALVEDLVNYGNRVTLAWGSSTMIALLIGFAILAIFLITAYRLNGITALVTVSAGDFFTLLAFNAIGIEFNVGALIGLLAVSAVILLGCIFHFEKFGDECYRGRTMKKANSDAYRRAFLPTLDAHAVLLLISIVSYALGTGMIQSFAVMGVLGSLISWLLNLTFFRLSTWLTSNTTSFQKKYKLFHIDEKKIPNLMNEEKQTYFGEYDNHDFTKKSKISGLVTAITGAAMVVAMIVIGSISSSFLAQKTSNHSSRIYLEIHEVGENDELTKSDFEKKLNDAGISFSSIQSYETEDKTESLIGSEYALYYWQIDCDKHYSGDEKLKNGQKFSDFIQTLIAENEYDSVTLRTVRSDSNNVKPMIQSAQPKTETIILAAGISIVVVALYLWIRYGISQAIAGLVLTASENIVVFAFFAITRIQLVAPSMLSILLITTVSSLLFVANGNAIKEYVKEHKKEDLPLAIKNQKGQSRNAMVFLMFGILTAFLVLDYFGFGPSYYQTIFAGALIGIILAMFFGLVFYVPFTNLLQKWFHSIYEAGQKRKEIREEKRQEKKGKTHAKPKNLKGNKNSSEPEEAVFIGIND